MELAGFPRAETYRTVGGSPVGVRVEQFSDRFRAEHRQALRYYRKTWVDDPVRQWSRRWEYPFVVSRLEGRRARTRRLLDAGSGLTFLPFELVAEGLADSVDCVDVDPGLVSGYRAIGDRYGAVRYQLADLRHLPFPDASFDVVVSVSVLEHVKHPESALDELLRVVRPGGSLLLTFDVSIDDQGDPLALFRACGELERRGFTVDGASAGEPILPQQLVTTRSEVIDRSSLPWRWPGPAYQLSCWLSGHGWPDWPPHLTFACLEIRVGTAR